jgi:hypothetical protein
VPMMLEICAKSMHVWPEMGKEGGIKGLDSSLRSSSDPIDPEPFKKRLPFAEHRTAVRSVVKDPRVTPSGSAESDLHWRTEDVGSRNPGFKWCRMQSIRPKAAILQVCNEGVVVPVSGFTVVAAGNSIAECAVLIVYAGSTVYGAQLW